LANTPKKPWVAFLLSILLTGAGLAYLGKWGWAALNFLAAIAIGVGAALVSPDLATPVGIGVAVGSAVLAKNLAEKMNKELAARSATPELNLPPVPAPPQPTPSTTIPQPVMADPGTVLCVNCGTKTEVANFCAECGAPLTPLPSTN
jgi:hypothetical protein